MEISLMFYDEETAKNDNNENKGKNEAQNSQ